MMRVLKVFILLFLASLLIFSPKVVLAQEVDSFKLFWPISAGRTVDDPLYSLKRFKEKVRGLLIFGKAQKADYGVFLVTKRVVEAEKLMNEGKDELSNETLEMARGELDVALQNAQKAIEGEVVFGEAGPQMVGRLENIDKLLVWLMEKYPDNKDRMQKVLDSSTKLLDILQ